MFQRGKLVRGGFMIQFIFLMISVSSHLLGNLDIFKN